MKTILFPFAIFALSCTPALALEPSATPDAAGSEADADSVEPVSADALMVTSSGPDMNPPESLPVPPPAEPYRLSTFSRQAKSVRWEVLAAASAITATRLADVTTGGSGFHFKNEGWFGKSTYSLGMDKMHHAWKTYVITDVMESIIRRRTGEKAGAAKTGAIISLGLLTYGEIMDGFTARTGFSNQDMTVHLAGAGLSLLRNTVPGLRDKLDFRMEFKPTFGAEGLHLVDQLEKRKYFVSAQLSGFKGTRDTPWRFLELHMGYYARGFSDRSKLAGEPQKRRVFLGLGFNVQALFSRQPKSRIERYAKGMLDYVQIPYTLVN
jgi:hypothetical protein